MAEERAGSQTAVQQSGDLFSLQGKTVLLTGAAGFLGRSITRALLVYGADVVALGRSVRLEAMSRHWCDEFGPRRVRAYQVDMYEQAALTAVLEEIRRREPFIEVVINNAYELGPRTGFNTPEGLLESASFEQWMRHLTGGVYWAALVVQRLGEAMKQHGKGSIINIASMYALVAPSPTLYEGTPFLNPPGYSASKAALVAFTRYLASFWGRYGIRANAISPGPFSNTEEPGPNSVRRTDEFLDRLRSRTCLGRVGKPEELQGAVVFLASDASSYVTGTNLIVDGGWTCI
jgi:gluconate 5-dehydrogenase